jgi:hypothetical protein
MLIGINNAPLDDCSINNILEKVFQKNSKYFLNHYILMLRFILQICENFHFQTFSSLFVGLLNKKILVTTIFKVFLVIFIH